MNEARRIIAEEIKSSDRLGVAVSGGADSVCLLALLLSTPDIKKENLLVINVEHGLRGEASKRDSAFVKELATKNGLEFYGVEADIPTACKASGRSEETEARLFRKALFNELLDSGKVDLVLTAHHRDDKTESVLMHVLRGSGTSGLIGMTARDGKMVRPLINTPKKAILDYVRENELPFVTDESNFDDKYSRNFLRLNVIPLIEERYPLSNAMENLSRSAKEDDEFINGLLDLESNVTESEEGVCLPVSVLSLPRALSSRYVLAALKRAGLACDFERKHIESVLSLNKKQSGRTIELPHGFTATRNFDRVVISARNDEPDGDEALDEEIEFCLGLTPFGDGIVEVTASDGTVERGKLKIDGDKVPDGAVIRTRRTGDIFTPYGGGTKKLKEYFIDKKIPAQKRNKTPLLCVGNKVLCIFGAEIADEVKLSKTSKNVLLLRYTED